jgi:hypothetical protein
MASLYRVSERAATARSHLFGFSSTTWMPVCLPPLAFDCYIHEHSRLQSPLFSLSLPTSSQVRASVGEEHLVDVRQPLQSTMTQCIAGLVLPPIPNNTRVGERCLLLIETARTDLESAAWRCEGWRDWIRPGQLWQQSGTRRSVILVSRQVLMLCRCWLQPLLDGVSGLPAASSLSLVPKESGPSNVDEARAGRGLAALSCRARSRHVSPS